MAPRFLSLADAIAELVHDGDTVAMEGFTHLIPFAAGHELIRQRRSDLTLMRMTPDVIFDQLIGAGAASALVFSWGGNPGVGSLHRMRDAVEHGWPRPLALTEYSHAMMAAAYVAGASGLPFGVLRAGSGTDLPAHNPDIRSTTCPFTGELLTAVRAHRPDVSVIHAQRADRRGNVQLSGILGVQKEAVYCARRALVTVEEVVDALPAMPGAVVLPADTITAIALAPGGAAPSYAQPFYARDNAAYLAWDAVSRSRERFADWLRALRGSA
jgi:glutaconate CoA-transferase subunit A